MSRQPVRFEALKEIRFAVVIYGGVSLAIYINGIVQEMLNFVRATAPAKDSTSDLPLLEQQSLNASERVYRKLGQILNDPDAAPVDFTEQVKAGDLAGPIRTRFVIDILSGTSAGGINAIFLGKALANNQKLAKLQDLWISAGDIEELINDRKSLKAPLSGQNPPLSLLNSSRMYLELLGAMDGMDDTTEPAQRTGGQVFSPLVDRLDLFSTATDIRGLTMPITLSDGIVFERRHKNVFQFQHPSADPKKSTDFSQDSNPFLAYAARCTSAFPFAFEPMELSDIFSVVSATKTHIGKPYCDPNTTYWERFYQDYVRAQRSMPGTQPFHFRAFGDGGYLDNKPFSYAIDTTLRRHADLPVERKLVYIEPNPEELSAQPMMVGRPDALENSLAALLVLPRYETIREDLQRVVQRNLDIERVNRVVNSVMGELRAPISGVTADEWLHSARNDYGGGYATYERLKLSAVTDTLADLISVRFGVDPQDALGNAVRTLAGEWRDLEYPESTLEKRRRFLLTYDIEFRLRRIRYVRRRIQEEYAEPMQPRDLPEEQWHEYRKGYREALQEIKAKLGEPYRLLQGLLSPQLIDPERVPQPIFSMAQLFLVAEPPADTGQWRGLANYRYIEERSDRGARSRAVYVLQVQGTKAEVTALAKKLADRFGEVVDAARTLATAAFEEIPKLMRSAQDARSFVRIQYRNFEKYDSAAYPITFGTDVDDNGPISIHRISPDDAKAREADVLKGRQKLKGQALGSFGGFLDKTWRENDILWGRLDGAERLIGMVLPGPDAETARLRKTLIDQAHEAIVNEFVVDPKLSHLSWEDKLRAFIATVPAEPDPKLVARSAARSTTVVGNLLQGIADTKMPRAKPLFARMAFFGRMCWNFVEVSVPRTWGELLGSYWMQLLMLFSLLLIALAIFTPSTEMILKAIMVSTSVAVLYGLRELLRRYLRGVTVLAPVVMVILTVVLVAVLTALITYLSSYSLADILNQLDGKPTPSHWPGWSHLFKSPLGQNGLTAFIVSSVIVAGASGVWSVNAAGRAEVLLPGVNVIRKLKFARLWDDVLGALGIPVESPGAADAGADTADAGPGAGGSPGPTVGLTARIAKARDEIVRAEGVRAAAIRAIRADYVFAAGYALLFVSVGVRFVWSEWHGDFMHLLCAWSVGIAGILAAVLNVEGNHRVINALKAVAPAKRSDALEKAPYGYNVGKWVAILAAIGALAFDSLM